MAPWPAGPGRARESQPRSPGEGGLATDVLKITAPAVVRVGTRPTAVDAFALLS